LEEIMSTAVALVTGASSGIGEATARRLHAIGYTVYAAARRLDRMQDLADAGIRTVRADLTDDADMVALIERIVADTGRIDVLVNNAGYGSYGSLEEVPMAEARRQVEINVFALARLTQLALPHMRAQRSGYVINISSMGGKFGESLGAWYHATKFAVEGLSDSIRPELSPFGIHVVVVEPGAIRTEWGQIAADNLIATSGHGPYAEHAQLVGRILGSSSDHPNLASSPEVVADAIEKAVTARRPKTRYAIGSGAKPMVIASRFLTDRTKDRLMLLFYKTAGRRMPAKPRTVDEALADHSSTGSTIVAGTPR
jgi:NAD(P)-dependent dehydrogenase (short-subunit alcohol dehydrogenase family)